MQLQPKQPNSEYGSETNQSFDVSRSPEVTAAEAYKRQLLEQAILNSQLSDVAYAQAASSSATLLGGDQLDPRYFSALAQDPAENEAAIEYKVTPEEIAWMAAATRNLTTVRQVVLRDDYQLGA